MTEEDIQNELLKKYCRAIVHMRQEIAYARFGLIFGAGIGTPFHFPDWEALIKGIAEHPDIAATELLKEKRDHTSMSQILFQYYRAKQIKIRSDKLDLPYNELEVDIKAGWIKIVKDVLYKNVTKNDEELKNNDTYILSYINIMKNRVTVNFNFDNTIERLLFVTRTKKNTRGYKTIYTDNVPQIPDTSIIYHPNGFLPIKSSEKTSRDLIFLEDSFQDQLIGGILGHYAFLVNHLAQQTCLFIGHSLGDATVKHLLRHNSIHNPGQYHYFISYSETGLNGEGSERDPIFDVNFNVYNLITMFLNNEEILALGNLLSMEDEEFKWRVECIGGYNTYKYFVTGSVAIGKSTIVSNFKNLTTHEEWLDPLIDGMEKDPSFVEPEGVEKIDKFIAEQVALKNAILDQRSSGIYIVDRCPLDAFGFTKNNLWKEKAELLRSKINPGLANRKLCPGHIIFMVGDPGVIAVRALAANKKTDEEKLKIQQEKLKYVYIKFEKGVSVIDIRDKNVSQVVKEVAKVIHKNDYIEAPMDEKLSQYEKGIFDD